MKLGEYIYNFRKLHDMTMDEFAKKSSLSKGYISMLEKGYRPNGEPIIASIQTYNKIAAAVGCSVDELLRCLDDNVSVNNPQPVDSEAKELVAILEALNKNGKEHLKAYAELLAKDSHFTDK